MSKRGLEIIIHLDSQGEGSEAARAWRRMSAIERAQFIANIVSMNMEAAESCQAAMKLLNAPTRQVLS